MRYTKKYTGGSPLVNKLLDDLTYEDFLSTLPDNMRKSDPKKYNMRRLWELCGKPENFEEGLNREMFGYDDSDKTYHAPSVAYNKDNDTYEFMKSKDHPTLYMEFDYYNSDPEFNNYWKYDEGTHRYIKRAPLYLLGGSIVDYMKSLNMDSSKTNRAKLAKEYGIENYSGTSELNMKLLSLMKAGNKRSTATQNLDPDNNKLVTHITTKSKTTPGSENEKSWLGTLWDKGINYLNSKIDLSKYIDDSSTQPVTTQGNTGAVVPNVDKTDKLLVLDLLGTVSSDLIGTANPEMSPGTQLSQLDKQYIKALLAAYGIPVTGDLDDTTLEMFRYKNSITGKVNDLYQLAVKGGSTARLFINFGVRTALPSLPTKELRRDDFTDGLQRHFDKILTLAFNAKDGVYLLSGGMYSDGYAKGHKGHDNSFIATGTRILSGNDLTDAAYSVGGGAVRVATLPNGRRVAMITDVYDFNNDKGTNTDLTTLQGIANVANKLTVRPSSNTKYALYEDGTPVSEEDIQIAYNLGEDFLKSTTKRPLLARHVPNLGYKATTWTGKGNK